MRKVLFVTSEAHPLMKTGGLGDVCGSLPRALAALGEDVRLLMPGYRDTLLRAGKLKRIAQLTIPPLAQPVSLLEGRLPGTRVKTWLVDFPPAFDRPGNPYLNIQGHPWHDNAARYALFARVAAAIARGEAGLSWLPDLLHAHDWQTGLVPALLTLAGRRPATVFTIHNLSYQGLFPYDTFLALDLPPALWSVEGLEFHGQLSFMKGGLAFADALTTVSPSYAREVQTPEHGCGLDGLLRHRSSHLHGILNGIDTKIWNPARDPHLVSHYSVRSLARKAINKSSLQQEVGLSVTAEAPLLGVVGRLVEQKGVDLVLSALPALLKMGAQLVALGTGETRYEQELRKSADRHAGRVAALIGYDEAVAHRIEASADMFLMPSRFEPCGLNQLYSLRYGTVPIVRNVGGLADTVLDATTENLAAGRATGIVFADATGSALTQAVERALALHGKPRAWRQVQQTGMRQDFSWAHSAAEYQRLYNETCAIAARATSFRLPL